MKKIYILLMISLVVKLQAQNYQISFTGTGSGNKVDSVEVQDISQCTKISLSGSNILNLVTTGINEINNSKESNLIVSPNPTTGNCMIDFDAAAAGETTLTLYDITGKKIAQDQEFVAIGQHTFSLNGIGSGMYLVKVISNQYAYSANIISLNSAVGTPEIRQVQASGISKKVNAVMSTGYNKSLVNLKYHKDDILKLTGFADSNSTVVMLTPTQSQTVTFNFLTCKDGDKNIYPVIQIGTQWWMEENLKTTSYNNGTGIPLVTLNTTWENLSTAAYSWYADSINPNKNIYGALYNYYAVMDTMLCPKGWHIPDTSEWNTLINYLGGQNVAAGKLKDTCSMRWNLPNPGAINSSGFTALPGGVHSSNDGNFYSRGDNCNLWSSTWYVSSSGNNQYTNGWYLSLNNDTNSAILDNLFATAGFSVRCLKNN